MYDVAIIGAGVIGAAIARELSRYNLEIVILDKENDVSAGTSKANSAIIHAGYDPEENTLMAKLNAEGNKMFDAICEELSVPFKRNGSLVVAFDDEQLEHIDKLKQRGINNGIPGLKILSKEDLLRKEKFISQEAKGALLAETGGIIDPMLLTISLMENAVMNGAEYFLDFEVKSIQREAGNYKVSSHNNSVIAKYVINAAGVFADKIHDMVAEPAFKINPRRGQYFLLDKEEGKVVNATLFPCPSKIGKGILVSPTIHGNVILGPASDDVSEREDVGTTEEILNKARTGAKLLIPKITTRNNIRNFAGMRAEPSTDDFIIKEAVGAPNFIDVAGIKSPGLTAAPAIALYVISILKEKGISLNKNESFNPIVKRKFFIEMTEEEQLVLIKKNPLYGRIICRCENITEGDIVDAIARKPGAPTMDGVKRRCRAGMGRCQGGFCGPRVQQILARELNKPLEEIVLEKKSSYILTGKSK
ncbi:MAG: NAD(P)/FAD-dependent oxidoreductase [Spirochaetaceae bacterium]|nr:NAD(P)/FAD-dependent oxidoreductase [Spirochaetaceae bacterium]